jgi:hypothetical protein
LGDQREYVALTIMIEGNEHLNLKRGLRGRGSYNV